MRTGGAHLIGTVSPPVELPIWTEEELSVLVADIVGLIQAAPKVLEQARRFRDLDLGRSSRSPGA
jgi:hypothetical protein